MAENATEEKVSYRKLTYLRQTRSFSIDRGQKISFSIEVKESDMKNPKPANKNAPVASTLRYAKFAVKQNRSILAESPTNLYTDTMDSLLRLKVRAENENQTEEACPEIKAWNDLVEEPNEENAMAFIEAIVQANGFTMIDDNDLDQIDDEIDKRIKELQALKKKTNDMRKYTNNPKAESSISQSKDSATDSAESKSETKEEK